MSEFSQADLDRALSEYRARLTEAVAYATAWHDRLENGIPPSSGEISEFTVRSGQLNAEVAQAFDNYSQVAAHHYHL